MLLSYSRSSRRGVFRPLFHTPFAFGVAWKGCILSSHSYSPRVCGGLEGVYSILSLLHIFLAFEVAWKGRTPSSQSCSLGFKAVWKGYMSSPPTHTFLNTLEEPCKKCLPPFHVGSPCRLVEEV